MIGTENPKAEYLLKASTTELRRFLRKFLNDIVVGVEAFFLKKAKIFFEIYDFHFGRLF